jgi:hypothetical protein
MYKIKFTKFSFVDGEKGNVPQGNDEAYCDCSINEIELNLNMMLAEKEMFSVIENIERVKGFIVK